FASASGEQPPTKEFVMSHLWNLFCHLTQTAASKSTGRQRRARPALEGLEDRWAPAVISLDSSTTPANMLKSSPGADGIAVISLDSSPACTNDPGGAFRGRQAGVRSGRRGQEGPWRRRSDGRGQEGLGVHLDRLDAPARRVARAKAM